VRFDFMNESDVSQNHRIVGVGRDLCGSSSPTKGTSVGHLVQPSKMFGGKEANTGS